MYDYELTDACYKVLHQMLRLQPGESVAITCDTESDADCVRATAQAALVLGAKPLVLRVPVPCDCGKAGDMDLPLNALVGGIKACDAWVEYNRKWLFLGTTYDRVVEDPAARPRYLNLCGADKGLLVRNVAGVDHAALAAFIQAMAGYMEKGRRFRVTTPAGTDIVFENKPGRGFSVSDGIIKKGEVKMLPGQISWSPEFDSVNGTIVVDGAMAPPMGVLTSPISLTVGSGYVIKIRGEGNGACRYAAWLKSFGDPNMFLCGHLSFGFGPKARLTGNIVEDSRVWGCVKWGWGNVGPHLVPDIPGGIPAASHSGGVCLNASVWQDGVQVLDKGVVAGPTGEIVRLARRLGK